MTLLAALFRPRLVRRRLERLRALGHIDVCPSLPQMWVAARDQIFGTLSPETHQFYDSQGIPWVFHNLRRFLAGPATVMDPLGLFSSAETICEHVLQTFHRHPLYDFVLLRAHSEGLARLATETDALLAGRHPKQRMLMSLIEDGEYHARLADQIRAFQRNPHEAPAPIPLGLLSDPVLMVGMDQFKDIRGFTNYAARLDITPAQALQHWCQTLTSF